LIRPKIHPQYRDHYNLVSRAFPIEGNFFSLARFYPDLAPKKKPTKFEQDMATSIDDLKTTMETMAKQLARVQDLAKQFAGFQDNMATALDKLNDLQTWRTITETSLESMMQQTKEMTNRVLQLESRPPPQLPPQQPLPHGAPLHHPQQLLPQGAPLHHPQQPPPYSAPLHHL
jgi:hypothetical protein